MGHIFERIKKDVERKAVAILDTTKMAYTQFGVGPVRGNPKRCLACGQPIRVGEEWVKDTSEADPEFGAYTVIRHSRCT